MLGVGLPHETSLRVWMLLTVVWVVEGEERARRCQIEESRLFSPGCKGVDGNNTMREYRLGEEPNKGTMRENGSRERGDVSVGG